MLESNMRRFIIAVAAAGLVALTANPAEAKELRSIEVSITGPGLDAPLTVREPDKLGPLELLVMPYTGTPAGGPPDRPGPAYELVFTFHNAKRHTVVLYPYASTGPFMELETGPPDVPLTAGWYRTWGSAVKPLREAGVPLGPAPWEQQTDEAQAIPPIERRTGGATILLVAGTLIILILTVYAVGRRIRAWQQCRSRPSSS